MTPNKKGDVNNKGFRIKDNKIITYNQTKCGLSSYHNKQGALNDKILKQTIQSNKSCKWSTLYEQHTKTSNMEKY